MPDTTNDIDALREYLYSNCRAEYFETFTALIEERNALQRRVEELEAASKPADRDLREGSDAMVRWMDQVTAMLCHSMRHSHDAKQTLVTRCDAAIIAMRREGEADA